MMSFAGGLGTVLTAAQPCILQIIFLAGDLTNPVHLRPTFTAQSQIQDCCCLAEERPLKRWRIVPPCHMTYKILKPWDYF